MSKLTVEMNEGLSAVLEELADKQETSKAAVLRRSLTLMKLAEDQAAEGYKLKFSKDGETEREVLIR